MRKEYLIEGISCEMCKNSLEDKVSKNFAVKEFSINILTNKMVIDSDNNEEIIDFVKKEEKDVTVKEIIEDREEYEMDHLEHEHGVHHRLLYIFISCELLLLSVFIHGIVGNILLLIAYLLVGFPVLKQAAVNIFRGKIFDEFFLMSLATIAAILIGDLREAVFVMIFYNIGEYFQHRGVEKSRNLIKNLLKIQVSDVQVKDGDTFITKDPKEVEVGSIIKVNPGEKVGLDCIILKGSTNVDTKIISGESVPRSFEEGDELLAGMIVLDKSIECEVAKPYDQSSIVKMLKIVEEATSKKAKAEKVITRFAKYYTPTVVILAFMLVIILPFMGVPFNDAVYRAVILLVISCPCALVLSVPLTYFVSLGKFSKEGILVKGSTYVDVMNDIDMIALDKTGTITKGNFDVTNISNYSTLEEYELLKIMASGESSSTHPIAKSILRYYKFNYGDEKLKNVEINEIKGLGIEFLYKDHKVYVGSKKLLEDKDITIKETLEGSAVYMGINDEHVMSVLIEDEIKEDSKMAIDTIKKKYKNIKDIVMLTGDNESVAKKVANNVGVCAYRGGLLPEDKVNYIKKFKEQNRKVLFVGDGINDVPVMAVSDLGVSMGNLGSDIAIENSDIVINNDSLMTLAEGFEISKKTVRIVKQNIILVLTIKLFFIVLGLLGLATMWEAIFSDVGIALIAILNSLRILK